MSTRQHNSVGIEEARGQLGDLADRAHNGGGITYLTRYGTRVAAIVPIGSRATAAPDAAIDAAMEAAWPGLPEGISYGEARRRTIAAINAAYPHLSELLDQEAAAAVKRELDAASERIRRFGEQTGDRQNARKYARVVIEDYTPSERLNGVTATAKAAARTMSDVAAAVPTAETMQAVRAALAVGIEVTVPEHAVPEDWDRRGEVVELNEETVVVELRGGHRQELPTDEVTPRTTEQ